MGIGLEACDVGAISDQVKDWFQQIKNFWNHGGTEGQYSAEYYQGFSYLEEGESATTPTGKRVIITSRTEPGMGTVTYILQGGANLAIGDIVTGSRSGASVTILKAPSRDFSGKMQDLVEKTDREKVTTLQADLINRARAAADRRRELDNPDDIRIGLTALTVPPERIRVSEVRFNDSIPGLRTSSDALVKTGRGQIRIDLELTFPNIASINTELREIVGQFKISPFLPVESRYIFNAIMAKSGKVPPHIIKGLGDAIERDLEQYSNIASQMVDIIFDGGRGSNMAVTLGALKWGLDIFGVIADPEERARLRAVFNGMSPKEVYAEWNSWTAYRPGHPKSPIPPSTVVEYTGLLQRFDDEMADLLQMGYRMRRLLESAETVLNKIRETHQNSLQHKAPQVNRRPITPCVLHSLTIQTVPDEVDSLQARLSLIYWAYESFVPDLLYRNEYGGPTLEITECPFFSEYLDMTYLNSNIQGGQLGDDKDPRDVYLGLVREASGTRLSFEYPTTKFRKVKEGENIRPPGPTIPASHLFGGKAGNMTGYDSRGELYQSVPETLEISADDPSIIVQHIMIQIQNRIALQPIHGAMYGTAQHLGAMSARVAVVMAVVGDTSDVHDAAVGRIQRMKLEAEKVALSLGGRARRNHKIAVRNDVLSLCGVRHVQIDNVSTRTVPGEINSSVVRLDLTEYTVSQDLREQLRLAQPDLSVTLEEAGLEFGIELADAHRATWDLGTEAQKIVNESDCGSFCVTALYGSNDLPGIFSIPLLATFLKNKSDIRAKLQSPPSQTEAPFQVGYKSGPDGLVYIDETGHRYLIDTSSGMRTEDGFEPGVKHWHAISNPPKDINDDLVAKLCGAVVDTGDYIMGTGEGENDPSSDPLERSARQLAWEMILHWRALKHELNKSSKEVLSGTVPQVVRDSRNIMDIPPSPKPYIKEIVSLMRNRAFFMEVGRLRVFTEVLRDQFRPLRDYVQSRIDDYRKVSNYPDMHLPTYSILFIPEESVLGNRPTTKSFVGKLVAEGARQRGIMPRTREFLARFMPTWRDLGKPAPVDGDPYDLAKGFDDIVPPDFFYFHIKFGPLYDSYAQQIQKEAEDIYSPSSEARALRSPDGTFRKKTDIAAAARVQAARSSFQNADLKDIGNPDAALATKNLDLVPHPLNMYPQFVFEGGTMSLTEAAQGYGSNTTDIYAAALPEYQEIIGKFNHNRPQHLKTLFRECWEQRKDDIHRLIRAFPTFRLYFIELDNEEWGFWDDFYNYNAIADIKLSQHKFEPDLLEIHIINTTGNLDMMRSSIEDPDKTDEDARWRNASDGDPRRPVNQGGSRVDIDTEYGTGEPRSLDKFFLQVGTQIMLKMGYGSDPDDLETKFNGQIVEIEPGDVIRVVAQSYKNELAVPLNTYKRGAWSDPLDVLSWVMDNSPTKHFGSWSPYETGFLPGLARDGSQYEHLTPYNTGFLDYREDEGKEKYEDVASKARAFMSMGETILGNIGGSFVNNAISPSLYNSLMMAGIEPPISMSEYAMASFQSIYKLFMLFRNRKLQNVFLPRHNWLREWCSIAREFIIPDRTGLEVLHEMTRHLPGYVFDVRPYDHKATLFFGKPEQRYIYTSSKQDEQRKWRKLRQSSLKDSQASFTELFAKFMNSREFDSWKSWRYSEKEGGFDKWNNIYRRARAAGQDIGYFTNNLTGSIGGDDYRRAGERVRVKERIETSRDSFYDASPHLSNVSDLLGSQVLKLLAATFFNKYANLDLDWLDAAWGQKPNATTVLHALIAEHVARDPDDPVPTPTDPEYVARTAGLKAEAVEWHSRDEGLGWWLRNIPLAGVVGVDATKVLLGENTSSYYTEGRRLPQLDPDNWPGSILVSLHDWRSKLEWISQPIRPDQPTGSTKNPSGANWGYLRNQVFGVSEDFKFANLMSSTESGILNSKGHQIPRDTYERMVESILQYIDLWKEFIKAFDLWLQRQIGLNDTDLLERARINSAMVDRYQYNPRTKRFRNFHFASAQQHIIKNGIIATKEQMANTVIIKHPNDIKYSSGQGGRVMMSSGTSWNSLEWMINGNIYPSEKKVRVVTEINIEDHDKAVLAAFSNLAEAVRPMYRGELILRGNEMINPYDIVWLADPYEQMYGPVEVERAITHFNIETGYTTTIIPQCVAIPQSTSTWIDALMNGMPMALKAMGAVAAVSGLSTLVGTAAGTILIPIPLVGTALGATVGAVGGAYASWKVGDDVLEQMGTGAGIWGNLTGKGRYGSMNTPVDLIPLLKNGRPWTAGLRGWGDGNWKFRMLRRWATIKRGIKMAQPLIRDATNQVQRLF